ncbi:MFS transporter [Inquilinus limosus]|uniref:Major facilitator superfamily (MFS) profile domain-containing protein n=1 Tax=Inquilinus limosus TaxID=171674 RepID=A0A211ZVE5_9PROT|nr:MFS transporter [Inquilinus limosus]OWJ69184.1 hypothetical protein BWR60_01235 [Inquilinus limosus]
MSTALSPRSRTIALIVAGAFFMEQLDTTIIATAVPEIARALAVEPLSLNLAMTAYILSLAAFVPISGKIADRFGTRTVFAAATLIFTAASFLCGIADSLEALVAARVLQGLGGAMMAPIGRLIVLRSVSKSEMVEAMAWVLLPAMVAPVIGPALGGLITTYASWRWVFFINIPLGLVALVLILTRIEQFRQEEPVRFDIPGFLLTALCFASAAAGVEAIAHGLGGLNLALGIFAVSGAAMVAYLLHARRRPQPVLDLSLLTVPTFRWSLVGGSVFRLSVGGLPFLLPVAFQLGFGYSALEGGLIVLVPAVGGLAMKAFSTRILKTYGFRSSLIVSGFVCGVLLVGYAAMTVNWPLPAIAAVLLVFGLCRSLNMNAYGTVSYADVETPRMAAATSLFLTFQNLSTGFGVAVAALAVRLAQGLAPEAAPVAHFSGAFALLAAICFVSVGFSFLLERTAGDEVSGYAASRLARR